MKITPIDRLRTLPVRKDAGIWEVGLLELPPKRGTTHAAARVYAGDSGGWRIVSAVCASATHDGGAVVQPTITQVAGQDTMIAEPDDQLALRAVAACALDPHAPGVRPWNHLPPRIHISALPPGMKRCLDEFFAPLGVIVEVKPRLDKIEQMTEMLAEMDAQTDGADVLPPESIMAAPGMTLDRVRAFGNAARLYFDARLWRFLDGFEDLWQIEPAPPWPGLAYCTIWMEKGTTLGLAFFESPKQFVRFVESFEGGADAVMKELADPLWCVMFDPITEAPPNDAVLWLRESLPVLGKDKLVPVPVETHPGPTFARPTPEQLCFMEGVFRTLAKATKRSLDQGHIQHTVNTFDGPRTIALAAVDISDVLTSDAPSPGAARKAKPGNTVAYVGPVKAQSVYQFKITLEGVKPPIWRRLLVRSDASLDQLHFAIQMAFGWENDHMHEFVLSPARAKPAKGVKLTADAKRELRMAAIASERRFSGSPDGSAVDSMFGGDEGEPTDTTLLESLDLASGSILRYDYDFGDDWQHAIALEKTLSTPDAEALIASTPDAAAVWKKFSATTRTPIAACIAGARAGPIEDCGGPWGYMDVCAIMADPDHPDHAARKEWMEEYAASGDAKRAFDPERFEPLTINKLMAKHLKH